MIRIANLEEIQGMLLHIPELINSLEKKDPNFARSVKKWLMQIEQILVNNHLAIAADVAVLRGTLISAERGVVPEGIVFNNRKTARGIKDAVAADVLRKAENLISNAISYDVARVAEGEKITRQLVALAQQKGLIQLDSSIGEHSDMLKAIWNAMSNDPDLGPGTTHLIGLVGNYDSLILLDRMLSFT